MRWVDRGPEPDTVAKYARLYTQAWVEYYQLRVDDLPVHDGPGDSYWQEFRTTLAGRTSNNCWYCERQCQAVGGWAPTVDHFKPRSRCPQLTYAWSNWIFSCRRCNVENKRDKWPESGYVDPCAADTMEQPEQYFDYEAETGQIIAKDGLSEDARLKVENTIYDLALFKTDLVNPRFKSVRQFVGEFIVELLDLSPADRRTFTQSFLALSPAGRVAYLVFSASSKGQTLEYAGVKAIVADKLLRDGSV